MESPPPIRPSRASTPPRKLRVGTAMAALSGTISDRLDQVVALIDRMGRESNAKYPGNPLDLVVLPEHALQSNHGRAAADRAVELHGPVLETLGRCATQWGTYVVAPMILAERHGHAPRYANAAVLIDRTGRVAGVYRKVHLVQWPDGSLEGGLTPGDNFPVFHCDFGRLGIQICWDMSYEDGFLALAADGAEIVVVPSMSPQTVRPASYALRGGYYVVTSTPRNNVTVFNPIGLPVAQITSPASPAPPGAVLVHEIDLAYAILHWSASLEEGRALTRRFGNRVGYTYSDREDTGVFWSNDPHTPIATMVRELGLQEMSDCIHPRP